MDKSLYQPSPGHQTLPADQADAIRKVFFRHRQHILLTLFFAYDQLEITVVSHGRREGENVFFLQCPCDSCKVFAGYVEHLAREYGIAAIHAAIGDASNAGGVQCLKH